MPLAIVTPSSYFTPVGQLTPSHPQQWATTHIRRLHPDAPTPGFYRAERLFGMEARFWLNLQLAWDLYHAMHSPKAREIEKIEPLEEAA